MDPEYFALKVKYKLKDVKIILQRLPIGHERCELRGRASRSSANGAKLKTTAPCMKSPEASSSSEDFDSDDVSSCDDEILAPPKRKKAKTATLKRKQQRRSFVYCDVEDCKSRHLSAEALEVHKKQVHEGIPAPCVCPICAKAFRTRRQLNHHHREVHLRVPRFRCELCERAFYRSKQLDVHMTTHSGARDFLCSHCPATFRCESHLSAHVRRLHPVERPHEDNDGGNSELLQRMKPKSATKKSNQCQGFFFCDAEGCNSRHFSADALEAHKKQAHEGISTPCVCPTCNKAFSAPHQLERHQREIHLGVKNFVCDVCGRAFYRTSHLADHKMAAHSDVPNFSCSECPRKFKYKKHLASHIRTAHTGEACFTCDRCGKTFVNSTCLKLHIQRVHFDGKKEDRAWFCQICTKRFSVRQNLYIHIKQVHKMGGTEWRQFAGCDLDAKTEEPIARNSKETDGSGGGTEPALLTETEGDVLWIADVE